MTRIVPIRPDVHLRELMSGKHERPSMPREMRIELAVIKIAEGLSLPGVISPIRLMRYWLEDGTTPINSIRSAYRSLS